MSVTSVLLSSWARPGVRFQGKTAPKQLAPEKTEMLPYNPNLSWVEGLKQLVKASGWSLSRFNTLINHQIQEMRAIAAAKEGNALTDVASKPVSKRDWNALGNRLYDAPAKLVEQLIPPSGDIKLF